MSVFRLPDGLMSKLPPGCKVIGDRGYLGEPYFVSTTHNPLDEEHVKKFKQKARARHEAFNGRIKEFGILNTPFRHNLKKQKVAFEAVCVVCQYAMENGRPLFPLS